MEQITRGKAVRVGVDLAKRVIQVHAVDAAGQVLTTRALRLGTGVYELVDDHRGDTFRAVYAVHVADAIHVLHAFQKKSKTGIATPQPDVALIEKRLKAVLARYGLSGR